MEINSRQQFPFFASYHDEHGVYPVYLDNASTTLVPISVIDEMTKYYTSIAVSTGRGMSQNSVILSEQIDGVRKNTQDFFHTNNHDVLFTSGATDSANRLVRGLCDGGVVKKVITTTEEHSSVIVPLLNAEQHGLIELTIVSADVLVETVNKDHFDAVFVVHVSNATGKRVDIDTLSSVCIVKKTLLFVDYSQSVGKEDVAIPNGVTAGFFSAHKMLGPKGLGVTLVHKNYLKEKHPGVFGGGSVSTVTNEGFILSDGTAGYEPGTSNYPAILGFGECLECLKSIGLNKVELYCKKLTQYACQKLIEIGCHIVSDKNSVGVVSFGIDGIHPHDIEEYLSRHHIFVRSGFLCAERYVREVNDNMPIVRISIHVYNSKSDINELCQHLANLIKKYKKTTQ